MNEHTRKMSLLATYVMTVFYALHFAVPYFVLSKFLSKYFDKGYISLIFVVAGMASIYAGTLLSKFLKKYKDYKTLIAVCVLQIIVTSALPFAGDINLFLLAALFTFNIVLSGMMWSCISIFLEEFSPIDDTGSIRGLSLTISNFGALVSPFLASSVYDSYSYTGIFILSTLSVFPIMFFAKEYLKHIKEPSFRHVSFGKTLLKIKENKDLQGVFLSSFILNSFYAAMNIYFVLYLTETVGISLTTYLSVMVPIFLIPFILMPYELGKVSDQYFGEKKFMIFGVSLFSIVLISIYLFSIDTVSVFSWAMILLVSRVGATMCETENYTYFYKKINAENADLISIFHNIVNVSLVFVSVLGFILINLLGLPIPFLLFIIGLLGLLSVFKILQIHDTEAKKKIKLTLDLEIKEK